MVLRLSVYRPIRKPQKSAIITIVISVPRYVNKERDQKNSTSVLYVYGIEKSDEGTYSCIAENTAGSVEANLSLRVRYQEKSTPEPPFDHPGTGYVAAVAAGALIGTLLALGCVIGSVVFCTKRRRDQKRNAKTLVSQSKVVSPITKDATLPRKNGGGGGNSVSIGVGVVGGSLSFDHQQQVMYTEPHIIGRTASLERRDTIDQQHGYRSAIPQYLTEPDLINEVTESSGSASTVAAESYGLYHQHQLGVPIMGEQQQQQQPQQQQQQQRQLHQQQPQVLDYEGNRYQMQQDPRPSLSQLSYLDQDGYPLNFGLPKIPFNSSSTLPRLRQRIPEGSAAAPPARYTREAEFLARSAAYDSVLPRSDARYTAEGYPYPVHQPIVKSPPGIQPIQLPVSPLSPPALPDVPFIPSPPAAYRGEPTPLSPRSLMSKTAREAAAAVAARAEGARPPDHPESPDEGYVGDAMDV